MNERSTKKWCCSYYHDGANWSLLIDAYDRADAEARVAKLGYLRLDGELICTLKIGWLARAICWVRNALFISVLFFTIGCADMLAPRTSLHAGPVRWTNPKDLQVGSLQVTSNTNGTFTLSVSNLTTRMNPETIAISGQALGNIIKEAVAAGAAAK